MGPKSAESAKYRYFAGILTFSWYIPGKYPGSLPISSILPQILPQTSSHSSPQNTSSPLGVICLCRLRLPSLGILGTALICAPVPASPLLSSGLSPLLPRYESFFGDRTAVHRIDLPFRVSTSLKPAQQLPKLTSQGPLGAAHTQSRIGRLSA